MCAAVKRGERSGKYRRCKCRVTDTFAVSGRPLVRDLKSRLTIPETGLPRRWIVGLDNQPLYAFGRRTSAPRA